MTSKSSKIAIKHVRVFDGERISDPTTVIIDGDKIGTDASGAVEVDGEGGVLLPGLIDSHVHVRATDQLTSLTQWGVTTVLDMACYPPTLMATLREHSAQHHLADFLSAGIPATAPGSFHSRFPGIPQAALLTGPEQATQFVADRIAEGSDHVKLIADIPGPDQATLDALAAAARSAGKLTVAHAARYDATVMAIDATVDVITHVPLDKPLDSALAARLAAEKRVAIPTLAMSQKIIKAGIMPGLDYAHAHESIAALRAAKVPIFAGTDANTTDFAPVPHGESIHYELELLVQAGMSNLEALRSATVEPASYFGMQDRGRVEPGCRADLVLVAGDPLQDITATRSVKRVWCRGVGFSSET